MSTKLVQAILIYSEDGELDEIELTEGNKRDMVILEAYTDGHFHIVERGKLLTHPV